MSDKLFNVVAVNIETKKERIIAENKTEKNAGTICDIAAMRLGSAVEFFKAVPATH